MGLLLVQSIPRFARNRTVRFLLAEPLAKGTDQLACLKFEASSPGGVAKDEVRALQLLGSGTFAKVENWANGFIRPGTPHQSLRLGLYWWTRRHATGGRGGR
jgi:hypothetical protein